MYLGYGISIYYIIHVYTKSQFYEINESGEIQKSNSVQVYLTKIARLQVN